MRTVPPCPVCGQRKNRYLTKKAAKERARQWASRPDRTGPARQYKCGGYWHNTSADADTASWYRTHVDKKQEPA